MRGKAEFPVMKGFEFEVKGGTAAECMPPDPGHDMAEDEKLNDKIGNKKAGGRTKTEEEDLTFAKDVNLVGEKAKRDIKDGYVADIQGEKVSSAKGYDAFNDMVSKGMVADVSINAHNVGASLETLTSHSQMVCKELDEGVVVKGRLGNLANNYSELAKLGGRKAKEGAEWAVGKVKQGAQYAGEKAKTGYERGKEMGKAGYERGKEAGKEGVEHVKRHSGKYGLGAGTALGVGGTLGTQKLLSEEKCASGKTIQAKGAVGEAFKKAGSAVSEGAKSVAGKVSSGAGRAYEGAKSGASYAGGKVKAGYEGAKEGVKAGYSKAKEGAQAGYEKGKAGAKAAQEHVGRHSGKYGLGAGTAIGVGGTLGAQKLAEEKGLGGVYDESVPIKKK